MDAQQSPIPTATRVVRRTPRAGPQRVSGDICVLGAGIAGISAALEAARLGRKVIIVDALPALGGQAVNSIIGTFCGFWEAFPDDHVHYVPLGSLVPAGAANLIAVGRCIDADSAALSSVRVMGPCIAMGAAAAHALDLAGRGSVAQIDMASLRRRVHDNIERTD